MIAMCFTGCGSTTHLKDLMVVEGLGIDTDGEGVSICVQTLKADIISGGEAPSGNMTINTDESGKSVFDAISNLSNNLSKKVFLGHNNLIVFGSDIYKEGINEHLDYFLRSTDSRVDVIVCAAKGKANEIISSAENDSHIPCENIVSLLDNGEKSGTSAYVTINDVLNLYSDKTSDIYMPMLEKSDDRDNVTTVGIGIFNGGKLVYTTDADETAGLLFVQGKIDNCFVEFQSDKLGRVGVEIYNPKTVNSTYIKNGEVYFKTRIYAEYVINEIENGVAFSLDYNSLEEISRNVENKINLLCRKAFYACRSNSSDCLRVGEYLARDCPEAYDLLSDDWKSYFSSVKYTVSSDASLKKISDNSQVN